MHNAIPQVTITPGNVLSTFQLPSDYAASREPTSGVITDECQRLTT